MVSEELKQLQFEKEHWQAQKRNYDALVGKIQAIVHRFHGEDERWSDFDVLDQGVSLIAERAQVCEQRAKLSSKLTPSEWLRENGFGDSAVASDVFDKDGDPHALIGLMDEYGQERAEAAELALQKWVKAMDGRTPECAAEDLLNAIATCSDLRAALQAKEQKLAHEIAGQDYLRNQIIVLAKLPEYPLWTNTGLVKALKTKLAQARQQAIADLEKLRTDALNRSEHWADAKEETKSRYWVGVNDGCCKAIGILRSLTPPPALTHKKACAKCGALSSTLGNGLCPTCDPDCKAPPALTKEK